MDGLSRIVKNNAIKEHGKETRLRHASMRPLCVELKLDLKCLNRSEQEKLWHYFTQCRWLCNHLLSLPQSDFKSFDTKTRSITSLDKDGNAVERQLTMPACSSSLCIRQSSVTWPPLQRNAGRRERRTAS